MAGVAVIAATSLAACGDGNSASDNLIADCTPEYTFPTVKSGVLSVSVYDTAPYYVNDGGTVTGIDGDFMTQFAKDSCLKLKWDVMPSASVIQAVVSRRADIAAGGWYSTEERGKIVNLSEPTYVELPTIFSADGTDDIQDLVGKKVGTITGYAWVDDLKALIGASNLKEYQSPDDALKDLATGRIEYALLGGINAPYLVKTKASEYKGIKFAMMKGDPAIDASVNYALPNYPATKGNDELTKALNEAIAEWRESGQEAKTLEKYGLPATIADVSRYQKDS